MTRNPLRMDHKTSEGKGKNIDFIIGAQSIYMDDSKLVQELRRGLMRLSADNLSALKLLVELGRTELEQKVIGWCEKVVIGVAVSAEERGRIQEALKDSHPADGC